MSASQWEELEAMKFKYFSQPIKMNNNEFIVVPSKHPSIPSDGIYKYNTIQNIWIKIMDYNYSIKSTAHSAAFDAINQLIYVCNDEGNLLQFDLKKKSFDIVSKYEFGQYPRIIYIEETLHIIGGDENDKHLIFNKQTKQFQEIYQFDQDGLTYDHNLLYMKSTKSILLFGAETDIPMYQYSLFNHKWNTFKIESLSYLRGAVIVSTKNEEYIFILGGQDEIDNDLWMNWTDYISIYNVKNKTVSLSTVKMPNKNKFYGINMCDEYCDELLVFGFIHQFFSESELCDMQRMPDDLIQMIAHWMCFEYIHLIAFGGKGDHWKISVDTIIQSIQ